MLSQEPLQAKFQLGSGFDRPRCNVDTLRDGKAGTASTFWVQRLLSVQSVASCGFGSVASMVMLKMRRF